MIGDKYRIEINTPGAGLAAASPVNSVLEWTYEKEQGQRFYRKKLTTPLIFENDTKNNGTDFTKLYSLERNRLTRCDKIDVIVYKKCIGGSYEQFYNGYIAPIDGDYNVDQCKVVIPVRAQDQYTCLYDFWEKDQNILNLGLETFESRSTIGSIEYRSCTRTTLAFKGVPAYIGNTGCIDETEYNAHHGWTLVFWQINEGSSVETHWAREVFIGAKPGPDWTDDGGKWVRTVEVTENVSDFFEAAGVWRKSWSIIQYNLTGGLKLNDVLIQMVKALFTCNYKLVSNFFGINPDGTQHGNAAYSHSFDHVRDKLYIYDITDVQRAKDKTQNAQGVDGRGNISFKRMYENLRSIFNIDFVIDEDNTLRIEHVSYFNSKKLLDLTKPEFLEAIKGRWKYVYTKENLPIKENFEWMVKGADYNFDGLPIQYDASCSNDDKSNNEKTIKADYFVTAVDNIVEHPDRYPSKGFVLVERNDNGYIISGNVLTNRVQRNGNLGWIRLQDWYYRWDRPQPKGIMNGENVNFNSFKRTRKQDPIQIHICCADLEQFKPEDLVRTQLGWGEVQSAKYSDPKEVMVLELLHD